MQVVGKLCDAAKIAITGGGLMTLLHSFRSVGVHGFALWDAIQFVGLGQCPSDEAVRCMAEELVAAHSSAWDADTRAGITAAKVIAALAPGATCGITSARPAMISHPCQC